jgi:nucleoid DNA-binding protein/nucleoid-associated protein YgaU
MNERLNTRGLAELLANQTGMDKKRAEEFIDSLSLYFTQELERNKVVKIFGLGVFKIMLVRERESIHIQTGERFAIPAHHKITYVPDKEFKEQINRPFALFEPIETSESEIQVTDTQVEDEIEMDSFSDDSSEIIPEATDYYLPDESPSTVYNEPESTSQEDDVTAFSMPESLSQEENNVYEDETFEQISLTDEALYDDDYFDSNFISDDLFDENEEDLFKNQIFAKQSETEFLSEDITNEEQYEPLPLNEESFEEQYEPQSINEVTVYEDESGSATYIYEMQNEMIIPDSEDKNNEYASEKEESFDFENKTFEPKKKKKKLLLILFASVFAVLAIIGGSAIGTYLFLQHNSDKDMRANQSQDISDTAYTEDTDSSTAFAEVPIPDSNQIFISQTQDTDEQSTSNNNETGESNTITTQEEKVERDWLVPSPDKDKNEVKRADKPNQEIEAKNRELLNNRQSQLKNTATTASSKKTTTPTTTPATTPTTTSSTNSKLPVSIKMQAGSTLMQLALDYYGDKIFWVYIYEHNKSRIKNYNNVPLGTEIVIPAASTYGIDSKSRASLDKALQKQRELFR